MTTPEFKKRYVFSDMTDAEYQDLTGGETPAESRQYWEDMFPEEKAINEVEYKNVTPNFPAEAITLTPRLKEIKEVNIITYITDDELAKNTPYENIKADRKNRINELQLRGKGEGGGGKAHKIQKTKTARSKIEKTPSALNHLLYVF